MARGAVLMLLAAVATPASATKLTVEQAIGAESSFAERCALQADVDPATNKWAFKALTEAGPGRLSARDIQQLAAAVDNDDLYRVRVIGAEGSAPVVAAVKACALVAAGLSHNIRFMLDGEGGVRAADLQLAQPKGFSGCSGRQGIPEAAWAAFQKHVAKGEDASLQLSSRFASIPVDEASAIPALSSSKGAPYPGQKEFTEADVAAALGAQAGPDGTAKAGDPSQPTTPPAEPKTFLERNWHLLALGAVWMYMNMQKEEPQPAAGQGQQGQGAGSQGQQGQRRQQGEGGGEGGAPADRKEAVRERLAARVAAREAK